MAIAIGLSTQSDLLVLSLHEFFEDGDLARIWGHA
jgi:hypothetical protein